MCVITVPHEELSQAVLEYGGEWGLQHSRRLVWMVERLGAGLDYDTDIIWLTAYLHDWGGYTAWAQPGVEHHIRSGEVAREWLAERAYPQAVVDHVVECIVNHHGGPIERSLESRLFTDADALELLGVIGVCRTFAMCPRDLRAGVDRVRYWRETSLAAISLEVSRPLAERRLQEMDALMATFHEETLGMI